ncbi:MAG: hypothetical protein ACLPSH_00375 [Vulcanimicrobiaceae bacterium]
MRETDDTLWRLRKRSRGILGETRSDKHEYTLHRHFRPLPRSARRREPEEDVGDDTRSLF